MHIVITGGAGFLGLRLARTILAAGSLALDGAPPRPVTRLTLIDRIAPPEPVSADPRVRVRQGELRSLLAGGAPEPAVLTGADAVFHLAAAVSGECEADFDLGVQANLCTGYGLLQACRALPVPPVLVFASSLAVYGQWSGQPLPAVVTDTTLPTPRSSYGIQKYVVEQLVTDYTRKGFLNGRPVRLMTVAVRPGRPNAAASSFLSAIIREPLAGQRAVCPVPPGTPVALASPGRTIAGLLRAAEVSTEDFGAPLAMNLPALHTTVAEMVDALSTVAGQEAVRLIDWVPDPAVAAIVAGWPARFDSARARRLGLSPDPDIASIVRAYLADRVSDPGPG